MLARKPLYREVAGKIRAMIERGGYRPGERIPSTRELSRQLRVSVNTITHAYTLLEDDGIVEARPQSGYYVRATPGPAAPIAVSPVALGPVQIEVMRTLRDERLLPLGTGSPSPDLLPAEKLSLILAGQARRFPAQCAGYAPGNGIERLRMQLAKRSLHYGCSLTPDEFLVTSGCVEAVTLALQATCGPGDTVAVESPVYHTFLSAIQWMGLKALEIPSAPSGGISLEVLGFALQHHLVRACLLISNYGNPLGKLMPEEKKRDLVRLLARREIPLIEDDVYGDLGYERPRPPVFRAYDENGLVILCSSFSKTLAPGYRVGWIVPGRFRERVQGLKSLLNIATATPNQMAVAEYLSSGGYDRHLRTATRTLRVRTNLARECVLRSFPRQTEVDCPEGGYFLWIRMPDQIDGFRVYEEALRHGIGIAPGTLFTTTDRFGHCLRLNASYWSTRIEEAIRTVGRIARR